MLLDDDDLRFVITMFDRMEAQCAFIKKYYSKFPSERPRLVKILSEAKGINEEVAATYIKNLMG